MGAIKISDFGISRDLDSTLGFATTFVGTTCYMSPGRLSGETYTYSADLWSFGLMMLELAAGAFPYPKPNCYFALLTDIVELPPPDLPDGFSDGLRHFLGLCLRKEPEARPSAAELLAHPWLRPPTPPPRGRPRTRVQAATGGADPGDPGEGGREHRGRGAEVDAHAREERADLVEQAASNEALASAGGSGGVSGSGVSGSGVSGSGVGGGGVSGGGVSGSSVGGGGVSGSGLAHGGSSSVHSNAGSDGRNSGVVGRAATAPASVRCSASSTAARRLERQRLRSQARGLTMAFSLDRSDGV